MTIGEVIKEYREKNDISQRQFAKMCGVSNGYISMVERAHHPRTGEPITPSISALKSIASAMHLTLNELLILADDMQIDLSESSNTKKENTPTYAEKGERVSEFVELFQLLTDEQQSFIVSQIKEILSNQ